MKLRSLYLMTLLAPISFCWASSQVDGVGGLVINAEVPQFAISSSTVVTCQGGFVAINGLAPDNNTATCASIKKITVNGTSFDDLVDLSAVTKPDFSQIKSTRILLGAGNDEVIGSQAADNVSGNSGNDDLTGRGGNDRLTGSSGNDVLRGGPGSDVLLGGSGNDIIRGGGGLDVIDAGSGLDNVRQ